MNKLRILVRLGFTEAMSIPRNGANADGQLGLPWAGRVLAGGLGGLETVWASVELVDMVWPPGRLRAGLVFVS